MCKDILLATAPKTHLTISFMKKRYFPNMNCCFGGEFTKSFVMSNALEFLFKS